ncbi:MAG: histidine--tRNA ligase [Propionibacteriaceae bacterium]|nr:histidine--tRNA ligase [Propionibacteriaceae bacterium]
MARPKPISGFPEFLPAGRMVETRVLDIISSTAELHGLASVETRAVEPLEQLTRKGEIDKEIYVVRRLHAEASDVDQLALHFDLTVPFARYVLENSGHLHFPFRRYQVQKSWRGERPQEGRYREFTQADFDIVGSGTLALHHDAELPLVALEAFGRMHQDLGLPPVLMRLGNRKLAQGFYAGLGIDDPSAVLQRVDKLDKIGPDGVATLLREQLGMDDAQVSAALALARIRSNDLSFADEVAALGIENALLTEGIEEVSSVLEAVSSQFPGQIAADLRIARGLDYYTGTVYETEMVGFESIGSVSGGGRYDALASDGKNTYPGVGLTIGVTRILAPLIGRGHLSANRSVPSCVLVAVDTDDTRTTADDVARRLRARGIACEVAPKADKYGKQIRHAERRGIPFVWFGTSVKDIRTGEQQEADPDVWAPPADDLRPGITTTW